MQAAKVPRGLVRAGESVIALSAIDGKQTVCEADTDLNGMNMK